MRHSILISGGKKVWSGAADSIFFDGNSFFDDLLTLL